MEKVKLPVETDAKRLVTHLCGSNLLAEGGEDIELKPDSEYPEWLWNLHIGESEFSPDSFKLASKLDYKTMVYQQF